MPRMFDILRGKRAERQKAKSDESVRKKNIDLTVSFPRTIRQEFHTEDSPQGVLQMSEKLIETIKKKGIDNNEIAKEKYDYALRLVEISLVEAIKKENLYLCLHEINETIDNLINQLILGDSLLENIVEQDTLGNYLPRHITNVCILSLAVGMQMKWNKSKLHTLGIAAILHDVGMLSVKEIISHPRKLSVEELKEVQKHPFESAKILSGMGNSHGAVEETIQQHHERINGKGYPLGLEGNRINDYAKIMGLVDTYEAMTHSRTFRKASLPHQAIIEIMHSGKPFFEAEIIKALVDKISIYPVGSFIKLNSGEIAKVIAANPVSSLRPLVLIVFDAYGEHLLEPKTLDLSKSDSLYIKEPVNLASRSGQDA